MDGQLAVAAVTLNRVKARPWPNTVCEVVWEKRYNPKKKRWIAMFSWTFDPAPKNDKEAWKQTLSLAELALSGKAENPVGDSHHFHAVWMEPDAFFRKLAVIKQVGGHIFYE